MGAPQLDTLAYFGYACATKTHPIKHSQSRTAQSFRINSLAKELVLLRASIVLLNLEQQLLVDLVLVIPPALVPTDLI